MSIDKILWADSLKIKPIPSRVLIKLCSHYNDDTGRCFPSISSLQDSCQLSRQGVINAIKYLEDQKIIEVCRQKNNSNKYKINTKWSTSLTSKSDEVVNEVDQGSQRYGLEVVNEVDQGSQRGRPETVIKQEDKTVKETLSPNCSPEAHVDQNVTPEYFDKPPFAPDDISTKALEHRFDEFWESYPVKKSKKQALKSWLKIKPDQSLLDRIKTSITEQKKEKESMISATGFAPDWKHPSTWLNSGCWEDEIIIPVIPKEDKPRVIKSALADW